jgi:uncharacterized protein YdaU (DUF1376 family)
MSASPFMQLYVADYIGDTLHLTTEQHGAYLLLLMAMWRAGGKLPNEEHKLARIVGLSPARWRRISGDVMAFFDIAEGEVTQARLTKEIEKAKEKSAKRADAGSKGGAAKSLKDKEAVLANATVLPWHSSEPEPERERTVANATAAAEAPALSAADEIWNEILPDLVALSGRKEGAVRSWIGKMLSKHDHVEARDAMRAAIAAKTGDPFPYVVRILTPDPRSRGSPKADKPSVQDVARRLAEEWNTEDDPPRPSNVRLLHSPGCA